MTKLFTVMLDKRVLKNIFVRLFKVILFLGVYFLGLALIISTQTLTGAQSFGGIVITTLIGFFSIYAVFSLLPMYLFIKPTYESKLYLQPLAKVYQQELSPVDETLATKDKRKITLYSFFAALFAFVVIVLSIRRMPFLIPLGFLPLYVMIYKNWMKGLYLALGEKFDNDYKQNKKAYMSRAIGLLILMHFPLFWFFQPWALQALAEIYFKEHTTSPER